MTTAEQARPFTGIWEREYPFASNWLDLGETRLHYVDEGPESRVPSPESGAVRHGTRDTGHRTLMFLHGNPTWSFYWRHLVEAFRPTNRCVALDHMGCGLSDKPQFYPYTLAQHIENARALVYKLDLRDIVLCVHD